MDVYCSYSACTPVTQRHAKSWKGKLFIVGPLWQMLWQNSKRPGARDGSPDFLLFVCSLRRSYLQCGERGRSALCVSVSWGSFSSKMFETSEENSDRVLKHWKHSVYVRVSVCACLMVLLYVLCGTMADDSFLHTGFHNFHFMHRWLYSFTVVRSTLLGLTGAEQTERIKKACCPCQDNQGSQQAGDLTKQMDLEHTLTWTKPRLLKNRMLLCCQKWYFGIFPYSYMERIIKGVTSVEPIPKQLYFG